LKILIKHDFPAILSTKSTLILRDSDLLSKMARSTWCCVGFTITTFDEELVKFLEPRAASPEKRLEAMKKIKSEHPEIKVGTNFMPIVPFLEDDLENMEMVVKKTREAGADFILFAPGMTLRDVQARFFFNQLKKFKPSLIEPIKKLYGSNSQPEEKWILEKNRILLELCEKYKIAFRIQRFIPSDFRKTNYIIAERFLNKAYLDLILGRSWKRRHWTGLFIQNLQEPLEKIAARGELNKIKGITREMVDEIEQYLSLNSIGQVKQQDLTDFF
ncbi:MAG: SPL family radical SAM protein, partial [Candidatus Helarchaeales archaeon]